MEFSLTAEQDALRRQARAVASAAVARFGGQSDSWLTGYSKDFAQELGQRRWIGLSWPVEAGGAGRPGIDRMLVFEELIRAGAPLGAFWFADRQIGPSLIAFGTPEQRARFLPPILSGDHTWCIGMSEPDAGSDLTAIRTRAEACGGEWVISGRKIWTSFASQADYCYLICRTSSPAKAHEGLSELIVPMDAPGIEVRPIPDMAGGRHFCEVTFDDVRVPRDHLVGTEGAAFRQTMRQLEHERGGIDRLVSNDLLYRAALRRADTDDPTIRQEIARLEATFRLGRLLVYREALGQAPKGFSAATKCFCTEYEGRVADFVSRVLGAEALIAGEFARGLTYAPAYTIMGGTSNIMRTIVAERILGLPKS